MNYRIGETFEGYFVIIDNRLIAHSLTWREAVVRLKAELLRGSSWYRKSFLSG